MNKEKYKKIIISSLFLIALMGVFVVSFWANNNFFIEKDFNQAFLYRTTGDCDSFSNYLNKNIKKWKEKCKKEKEGKKDPIKDFSIQRISHNFGEDRAFLQVELTRSRIKDNYSYIVTYEMKKVGSTWKINQ